MGIAIVPTYPLERRALFNDWQNQATTEMTTVEKWMTEGYILKDKTTGADKLHVVDEDHNWVCVSKSEGVGCMDIDDLEACQKLGMPALPEGFTVDTPSGGLHRPFQHDERTRKLGNRNVIVGGKKVFEFKGNNAPWCAPWQWRADGGYYKPRAGNITVPTLSDELIAWIEANSKSAAKEPKVKVPFKAFHPTHDQEAFLDHFDTTEHEQGKIDGQLIVVPESCPKCGKDAKDTTLLGAISKFFFSGNYWNYFCNACGAKRDDLEEEYGQYEYMIFEDEDNDLILAKLGVVEADAECIPCIHLGESSYTHTRVETLPKVHTHPTLPTPEFYPVEWSEELTDSGNAEIIARYFGFDILFVPEAGKKGDYFVWTGTHWEHDKGGVRMLDFAKSVSGVLLIEAGKLPEDSDKRSQLVAWAMKCGNMDKQRNMIDSVRTLVKTVHKSEFNRKPMLFNCKDGTVDLKTGQIRPYDRNDLLTKCVPIQWDLKAECGRWEQYLQEVFDGNQPVIDFIQRAVGYTLTGLTVEEVFFVGYGRGRNGKGKFSDTLTALMGENIYARPAKFDIFVAKKGDEGKANDMAELFGARYVPASEGEQSKRLAEAKIKNMVSGDPVEGEKKFQDSFVYYPEYKIWLYTNYKPRIVGTDEGIWDKVIMIPFNRYFAPEERDRRLLDKLKAELPGILQWAIRGCMAWQERGLGVPECLKQATEDYRNEQNVLGHFVDDELIEHDGLKSPCGQMYERYTEWAEKNGEYQMTSTEFKDRMEQRYGEAGRGSQGKFWKGVGIKQLLSEEDKWMLKGQTVEEMEAAIQ